MAHHSDGRASTAKNDVIFTAGDAGCVSMRLKCVVFDGTVAPSLKGN